MRIVVVMFLFSSLSAFAGNNYPLKSEATHRFLTDSTGAPFLIVADSPHTILANIGGTNIDYYITNRANQGFNSLWIECLADAYVQAFGAEGSANYGKDAYNQNPFTSTLSGGYYDLTTPNEAYWTNLDAVLTKAGNSGLQGILTPLDEGGWTQTALRNGTNGCYSYGQFLGNRYKNVTNILWNMGNDFQEWGTATNEACIRAIADGIHNKDSNHLMTIQLAYELSESLMDTNWWGIIDIDGVYSYFPTYGETYQAYNRTNNLPTLFLEGHYEGESNGGAGELGTPAIVRRQAYWGIMAGGLAGTMYGRGTVWQFNFGWQNYLVTSAGGIDMGYLHQFFTNYNFQLLVPDQSHTFVTAGYGTYSTNGAMGSNTYSPAALAPDKTLGMVYAVTNQTLTVDMTKMAGTTTAKWFDPTSAAYTTISTNLANSGTHNFTPSGNNSGGDGDWMLVLTSSNPAPDTNPIIRITFP